MRNVKIAAIPNIDVDPGSVDLNGGDADAGS